jgi:hypothetical protein
VSGNISFVKYSWSSTLIVTAWSVLHEIQCTPRHVSSRTAASVQRGQCSCGYSDKHPHCDAEVSLRCQQELHLGVFTGKHQRIQNWRGAWRPCSGFSPTYPSVATGVTEEYLATARSAIMQATHSCSAASGAASNSSAISIVVACKPMWQHMRAYQSPAVPGYIVTLGCCCSLRSIP